VSGLDPLRVRSLLDAAKGGVTADQRGKRYEELLAYVFASVPGSLVVRDRRSYFGAEQVDLAVSNGGAFPGLPGQFLVECKNYSEPVDSKSVGYFLFICISRGAELAVVAAADGLTGDATETSYAHSLALAASSRGCRLVVITTADLLALKSSNDLVKMLRERWLGAWANGGVGVG
jgi:hypothetical protein